MHNEHPRSLDEALSFIFPAAVFKYLVIFDSPLFYRVLKRRDRNMMILQEEKGSLETHRELKRTYR